MYEIFDKLEAACKEQNREEAVRMQSLLMRQLERQALQPFLPLIYHQQIKQYNSGKLEFDEILKQLDLPIVDYADSKKIVTP